MLTNLAISSSSARPYHLRPACDLVGVRVSSLSLWDDPFWMLDNPSIGQSPRASWVIWSMQLPDGRNLLDVEHATLLDWLRRFVWSLFTDPRDKAKAYKTGNGSQVTQGLRTVVPWLVERGISLPHQIDRNAVEAFIDDLPALLADEDVEDEVISEGAAYMPIKIIDLIWKQRQVFLDAGIQPPPEKPWSNEKGANTLAKRIASEARGWIRPLPDEVAIPIVNAAAMLLGQPAVDVIALREALDAAYYRPAGNHWNGPGVSDVSAAKRQHLAASQFEFSPLIAGGESWHPPLKTFVTDARFGPVFRARRLVAAVMGAACITIQASAGLRASEICGLLAGVDAITDLPKGVRIETSSSGLNEVFVLKSDLTKLEEAPRKVDWLLGMRPIGGDEIPLPVRAMLVLDRLLRRERVLAKSERLLVSIATGHGFPRTPAGVAPFDSLRLNDLVKDFVEEWVDLSGLSDESAHRVSSNDLVPWRASKGRIIRPHQFRKTYAQFALSVDTRLLPAVQRQFHHVSMAMTEGGYWGRNRIQIEPMDSVASQLTAMQLFEMVTGRTKVAGKRGAQLEAHMAEVRQLTDGLGIEAGWRQVMRFVREQGLHMWFAPAGNCLPLGPANMECHKVAGTRPIGLPTPNYTTREPSLCAGCSCFIVDRRHAGFWEERYVSNEASFRAAEARGQAGMFRIARSRADVALKLLVKLGVDAGSLESRINQEVANARH